MATHAKKSGTLMDHYVLVYIYYICSNACRSNWSSVWVAANARRTDRHVPNFSLSVLHRESSGTPRVSVLLCDNEYRNLQNKYGFRWGSDSQHLHTRFVVKRSVSKLTTQACLGPVRRAATNCQTQPVTPVCRQFNSLSGSQWHVCLVPNNSMPHNHP